MHTLELRDVIVIDGHTFIEEPDLNEYYLRLLIGGYFDMKVSKKDNNSVGDCWYRAHAKRLGVTIYV